MCVTPLVVWGWIWGSLRKLLVSKKHVQQVLCAVDNGRVPAERYHTFAVEGDACVGK